MHGNTYFANLFNVSNETVSRWLSHLQELNYIKLEIIRKENKEIIQRRVYIRDGPYYKNETPPIDKKINTLLTKKSIPIDEKVKENNKIYNIDDLFSFIIKKEEKDKISIEFNLILQKLELNYDEEILKKITDDKIIMIKEIIYVIYLIYISSFKKIIEKINRKDLIDIYLLSKEKNPNNFINYYKKAILNKYS